jgi:catechol 2,3-dioxygenase-like lactoylglutathione lyase family enzyme
MTQPETGTLHHVELWVPDLERAVAEWGWLLGRLGYEQFQDWPDGRSWRLAGTYLVVEQSPALAAAGHDRLRPGLNHLAFHAGSRQAVDDVTADAPAHGWALLFPDRHPYAGGPGRYAAYLANTDGFETELVAAERPARQLYLAERRFAARFARYVDTSGKQCQICPISRRGPAAAGTPAPALSAGPALPRAREPAIRVPLRGQSIPYAQRLPSPTDCGAPRRAGK